MPESIQWYKFKCSRGQMSLKCFNGGIGYGVYTLVVLLVLLVIVLAVVVIADI